MKRIQSISVYGGLLVVIAVLAAITAQGELKGRRLQLSLRVGDNVARPG